MAQSPLSIERYHLRKLSFSLKEEFENGYPEGVEPVAPRFSVQVETGQAENDLDLWRVIVDINGGDQDVAFPYTFEASYVGFFRVAEAFPEHKKEMLATVNGPSILFAAAREFLSLVTARSPFPPIMLPSMSFVPDSEKKTSHPKKQLTQKKSKTSVRAKKGR